ncbi:MAG: hypothetical protein ACN0LA_12340 [Candidatus Longimicrobiales bacterium M2_2A_002]
MRTTTLQRVFMGASAAAVAGAVFLASPSGEAEAIPAFARKYGVSCSLCHAPAPRLTSFGEQFAANGFRMAPGEEPRDSVDTGDPLLQLMDDLPLAVRLDAYVQGRTGGAEPAVDLQTPWMIKVLSGGRVADKVSYYMYFFMSERGEVAGLEDAYVQFSDVAGSGVDLLVGQFQVSDPLFKRELRLEYEDYQPYRVRVGTARADLTYDRGVTAAFSPWDGADASLQLLNGRGLDEAGDDRVYDSDDGKAIAARLAHDFGGFRLGGFGYYGVESGAGVDNAIRVFGPDLTVGLSPTLHLNAQYLRRLDDRPFFDDPVALDTEIDMGFAELLWTPEGDAGRWFFTALYNHIDADAPVFSIRQGEAELLESYRAGALGANYLLARNVRLTGEVQYDLDREDYRFVTGFMTAF